MQPGTDPLRLYFNMPCGRLDLQSPMLHFHHSTTPCAGGLFSGMGFCVRYTRLSLMLDIWTRIPLGNARTTSTTNFQKKSTLQQNGVLTNSERSVSESCRLFCCFANACAPRVTSCDRSGPTVFLKHARHSCLRVPTSYVYPEFLASRSKPDTMTRQCKCWPKKMHFLCAICGVLCCVLQRRRCLAGRCFLPSVLFRYLPSMQGMHQTFPNTSMDSVSETA